MTITKRIILLSTAFISIIIGMCLLIVWNTNLVKDDIDNSHNASFMIKSVFELNTLTYEYMMYHEDRMQQQWYAKYQSFGSLLNRLLQKEKVPERRDPLNRIATDYKSLGILFSQLQASYIERSSLMAENRPQSDINRVLELESRQVAQLLSRTQEIVTGVFRFSTTTEKSISSHQKRIMQAMMGFIAGFAILTVGYAWFAVQSIVVPLSKLAKSAAIVGTGNWDHKFDNQQKDEIGELSRMFDQMLSDLKKVTASRDELEREITERKQAEMALQRLQVELEQQVQNRTADLKTANAELEKSLGEKKVLLKEIHHRVKNNMAIISSMLGLQSHVVKDEMARGALQDSQNRVQTMAKIHESLYRTDTFASVNMQTYLSELGKIILKGYSDGQISLRIEAENFMTTAKQALPIALIANELITNAIKYAFPDDGKGEVVLSLQARPNQEAELIVSDYGAGMPTDFDWQKTNSLGLKLVKTMAEKQLNGSIAMESKSGTQFTIRFPTDIIKS